MLPLGFNAVLHQHQHHVRRQIHFLHPLVGHGHIVGTGTTICPEEGIHGLGKLRIRIIHRRLRIHKQSLLGRDVPPGRGIITDPADEPLPLPVPISGKHLLRGNVQVMSHLLYAHFRRWVIAMHQPVQINLYISAPGTGHVFQNKLVLHRGGVKHGKLLIKIEHPHARSLLHSWVSL